MTNLEAGWFSSFLDIPLGPEQWDCLTREIEHPFFSWSWLSSLEASGSISPGTGWEPMHLGVKYKGRMRAAAILYLRQTSWGELFFDFEWAGVASQFGLKYYPKLVGTVPATPARGYRFLLDPELLPGEREEIEAFMHASILEKARELRLAQVAFLFTDKDWKGSAESRGMHLWSQHQFRWQNPGYSGFEDFLASFTKNQRRNISRERRTNARSGYSYRVVSGEEAPEEAWEQMYHYYDMENSKFGPYAARFLNQDFFRILGRSRPSYIKLVCAYRDGDSGAVSPPISAGWRPDPVGMAFLASRGEGLYGRYWGAELEEDFLHFNLCYYVPLEWAIGNGYRYFDPGVGSFHKARRGFRSISVYSAHHFFDPGMDELWKKYIPQLNSELDSRIQEMNEAMPQHGQNPEI